MCGCTCLFSIVCCRLSNRAFVYLFSEDDSCPGDASSTTDRLAASNADELEEATLRKMERRLLQQEDSRDEEDNAQDDYRHEFFELLDEVRCVLRN